MKRTFPSPLDILIFLYFNLDYAVCLLWITTQLANGAGPALGRLRLAHLLPVLEKEDVRVVFEVGWHCLVEVVVCLLSRVGWWGPANPETS